MWQKLQIPSERNFMVSHHQNYSDNENFLLYEITKSLNRTILCHTEIPYRGIAFQQMMNLLQKHSHFAILFEVDKPIT